jgi:helix-turn-helix protein
MTRADAAGLGEAWVVWGDAEYRTDEPRLMAVGTAASTGIGPVLRKARLLRRKSIEEASRETRILPDYLRALERDRYDDLLGDVYVRGFLRSYSTYLGLDADKVLRAYKRRFGPPAPALPEAGPAPARQARSPHPYLPAVVRRHPSWTFLIGMALCILGAFAAVGLLSRTSPVADATAPPALSQSQIPVLPLQVNLGVQAIKSVEVTVTVDGGAAETVVLQADEVRSFNGTTRIKIVLDRGARARLTVNGRRLGAPGDVSLPYVRSFGPNDFRESASPSG